MIKLVCDRCGKVLDKVEHYKIEVGHPPIVHLSRWGIPDRYDLCEDCMQELDDFLHVAYNTESITESDVDKKGVENDE